MKLRVDTCRAVTAILVVFLAHNGMAGHHDTYVKTTHDGMSKILDDAGIVLVDALKKFKSFRDDATKWKKPDDPSAEALIDDFFDDISNFDLDRVISRQQQSLWLLNRLSTEKDENRLSSWFGGKKVKDIRSTLEQVEKLLSRKSEAFALTELGDIGLTLEGENNLDAVRTLIMLNKYLDEQDVTKRKKNVENMANSLQLLKAFGNFGTKKTAPGQIMETITEADNILNGTPLAKWLNENTDFMEKFNEIMSKRSSTPITSSQLYL